MEKNRHRTNPRKLGQMNNLVHSNGGVDSILSAFYNKIIDALRIEPPRLGYMLEKFLANQYRGISNTRDRSSARGNLLNELTRPTMTWKVFCKGLRCINIRRFELSIHLHHADGRITEHVHAVNLGEIESDRKNEYGQT